MNKKRLLVFLMLALGLTGCSDPTNYKTPEPGGYDQSVGEILPRGSFEVSGGWVENGVKRTDLLGYVSFGEEIDGVECEADYIATMYQDGKSLTSSRVVKNKFGRLWFKKEGEPGAKWLDNANPDAARANVFFWPAFVAGDISDGIKKGAGLGELCSISLLPRMMRLTNREGGVYSLVFDEEKVKKTSLAGTTRWAEQYVNAYGLKGADRADYISKITEMMLPTWEAGVSRLSIEIEKKDSGYIIRQLNQEREMLQFILKPVAKKEILSIDAEGYFDQLGDNGKMGILDKVIK